MLELTAYLEREFRRYFENATAIEVHIDVEQLFVTVQLPGDPTGPCFRFTCEIGSDDDYYEFHDGGQLVTIPLMSEADEEGTPPTDTRPEPTILDYFRRHFPSYNLHEPNGSGDGKSEGETLDEMPLNSACGADCAKAIDAAADLVAAIVMAYGTTHKVHHRANAIAACVDCCLCYIRG